jgi:hypothetical protein
MPDKSGRIQAVRLREDVPLWRKDDLSSLMYPSQGAPSHSIGPGSRLRKRSIWHATICVAAAMQVPGRSTRLGEAARHETNLPASRARRCSQFNQVEASVSNIDVSASTCVRV